MKYSYHEISKTYIIVISYFKTAGSFTERLPNGKEETVFFLRNYFRLKHFVLYLYGSKDKI